MWQCPITASDVETELRNKQVVALSQKCILQLGNPFLTFQWLMSANALPWKENPSNVIVRFYDNLQLSQPFRRLAVTGSRQQTRTKGAKAKHDWSGPVRRPGEPMRIVLSGPSRESELSMGFPQAFFSCYLMSFHWTSARYITVAKICLRPMLYGDEVAASGKTVIKWMQN